MMKACSASRHPAGHRRRLSTVFRLVGGALPLVVVAMGLLPGVAYASGDDGHSHADDGAGFALAGLVVPMGIATLALMTVTVCLGLFRRRNPGGLLKWHKRCGPAALIAGAIHALLVLLAH